MRIGGRFQGAVERRRFYPVETTEYLINLGMQMVAKVVVTRWCFIGSLKKICPYGAHERNGNSTNSGQLRKQGHLYETQIHLVNSTTSITCVEHCKFLNPEKKKIANEQKERITLEKIQFQYLQYHHTIQLSISLFLCNTYHRQTSLPSPSV